MARTSKATAKANTTAQVAALVQATAHLPAATQAPVTAPVVVPVVAPAAPTPAVVAPATPVVTPVAPANQWPTMAPSGHATPQTALQPGGWAVTPTAAAQVAKATQQGAVAMRLSGSMVATLQAMVTLGATTLGTAVTHNQVAAVTGRAKGNQLRPLYAAGYTLTAMGSRGGVYSITPAGVAALQGTSTQATTRVAPVPAAPKHTVNFGVLATTTGNV